MMESIKILFDGLNELLRKLHTRYDINCGGCCFVAYIIARELEKRELFDYALRIYDYGLDQYSPKKLYYNIINNINGTPCGDNTSVHYTLVYNNYEVNKLKDSYSDLYFVDIPEVNANDIKRIYTYGTWNDEYSPSNNKFVSRFINIIFKNYDKKVKANKM